MTIKELQQQRLDALAKAEAIRLKYEGEKGKSMTTSEEQEWSNAMDEVDALQKSIEKEQRVQQAKEWGNTLANQIARPIPGVGVGSMKGAPGLDGEEEAILKGNAAWNRFLKSGDRSMGIDDLTNIAKVTSTKAYQADDPAGGGFLIAPQQFVTMVLTLMKDRVFMRQMATIYTLVKADTLGIPSIDVDPSDAEWTAELDTGSEETTMQFGKRELRPHFLSKLLKLGNKLVRNSSVDVMALVMDRIAYKFAVTEEKAFLTGDGAEKPLGVFTPSANGIPTGRDVTAASATALAGDDFIEAKYALKAQYQARAQWIMNRSVVKAVRKLKDTTGNYIWTSGVGVTGPGGGLQGSSERLLDLPINMSEYAPGTITSGLYTAIVGDFSFYAIADALDMQIQVLIEQYATKNQIGYIARKETDGMPILSEAFARLKMA